MILTGVATSQSVVNNTQSQTAPVTASQTLPVDDVSGATTSVVDATGNAATAAVTSGSMSVTSNQSLTGDVLTNSQLNVVTNAGSTVTLNTASTGNSLDVETVTGGGPVTGTLTQTVGAVNVLATNSVSASGAQTQAGSISTGTQAIANSIGVATDSSPVTVTTNQSSAATTNAEDGGTLTYTPGTAAFTASAVSNNLTGTGSGGANQTYTATQSTTGALTQAGEFAYFGNAQTPQTAATASDNNISLSGQSGGLNVVDNQTNTTYTQAETILSSYEFGAAQASAYGVGNSVLAANAGPSMSLDNTQTNSGGVVANASFIGNNGYDATSSATAMGNAATGFACSDCGGVISVNNNQLNTGGVSATSSISIGASNRSVTGTASAVGNNATFYVSKPSN
jgi:hypothetical protein